MATTTKPRYDWYETDQHIVVNILVKKMLADSVLVSFLPQSMFFSYKGPEAQIQELSLALNGTISPSESSYRVSSVKAEIKMRKLANFRWNKLEASENDDKSGPVVAAPMASLSQMGTAGSVKDVQAKSRMWDEQIKDVEKEEEKNGGVEELFRRIYSSSSEETRRAMNKSFQESNGTVLSTNWDEVGTGHVDMKPPESSEYKPW